MEHEISYQIGNYIQSYSMTTGLWNHQNLHKILQIHTPKYLSVPMYILIPPSLNFRAIIFHCEIFNTYPNMYRSSKRKCCNLYYYMPFALGIYTPYLLYMIYNVSKKFVKTFFHTNIQCRRNLYRLC